jgi:hypothetical protein
MLDLADSARGKRKKLSLREQNLLLDGLCVAIDSEAEAKAAAERLAAPRQPMRRLRP